MVPACVTVGTVSSADVSRAANITKAFISILPFRVAGEETLRGDEEALRSLAPQMLDRINHGSKHALLDRRAAGVGSRYGGGTKAASEHRDELLLVEPVIPADESKNK